MSLFTTTGDQIWRQYVVDGNSGSGVYNTERPLIITWSGIVETNLDAHETEITALQASMTTAESEIDTLQTEVYPITRGGTGGATAAAAIANLDLINLFFPVGSIRISSDNVNPGTYLTGTTWVAVAEGRAIVGVGANGESTWTAGQQQGNETHALTEAELASHTHGNGTLSVDTDNLSADFTARMRSGGGDLLGGGTNVTITQAGSGLGRVSDSGSGARNVATFDLAHDHTLSGSLSNTGSGTAHNNIQPSEAHYVWKRTV